MLEIHKNLISVDSEDVLFLLGDSTPVLDQHTRELVSKYISECIEVSTPQGGYTRFDALENDSNEEIVIEGIRFSTGKIISKMLRKAEAYAFFVATAGPGPETLARALMEEGLYLEAYIVDIIGSAIVESTANYIHEQIRIMAASQHLKVTNRYSPGYCSWNVTEQQKLFRLIPEGCCGISLSDSSLMSPIKSISGLIGIGNSVAYRDYTCELCSMKNCIFRKSRT